MAEQITSGNILTKEEAVQIILQAALQYANYLEDNGKADEHDRSLAEIIYAAMETIGVLLKEE